MTEQRTTPLCALSSTRCVGLFLGHPHRLEGVKQAMTVVLKQSDPRVSNKSLGGEDPEVEAQEEREGDRAEDVREQRKTERRMRAQRRR